MAVRIRAASPAACSLLLSAHASHGAFCRRPPVTHRSPLLTAIERKAPKDMLLELVAACQEHRRDRGGVDEEDHQTWGGGASALSLAIKLQRTDILPEVGGWVVGSWGRQQE